VALGCATTSLRAALILRAAWTAAREDAHMTCLDYWVREPRRVCWLRHGDGWLFSVRRAPLNQHRRSQPPLHPLSNASPAAQLRTSRGVRLLQLQQRLQLWSPTPRRLVALLCAWRVPRPRRTPQAPPYLPQGQQASRSPFHRQSFRVYPSGSPSHRQGGGHEEAHSGGRLTPTHPSLSPRRKRLEK